MGALPTLNDLIAAAGSAGDESDERIDAVAKLLTGLTDEQRAAILAGARDAFEAADTTEAGDVIADVYVALLDAEHTTTPPVDDTAACETSDCVTADDNTGGDAPDTNDEGGPVAIEGELIEAVTAGADSGGGGLVPAGTPTMSYEKLARARGLFSARGFTESPRGTGRFRATAAADTNGFAAGQEFETFGQISNVTMEKLRGLNNGGGGYTQTPIATFADPGQPDLYPGMSAIEAATVLDNACDPARLSGEFNMDTMTFGQGWCRPSDVLLDLCPPAATDGMWDAPSITISGGGIRYPIDTSFADLYATTGFCYTEAEEIARVDDKPCVMVPCPDFEEITLNFCGLCIEAGTLVDLAYPQLVSGYVAKSLAAFQHLLNARFLAAAWAAATPNDLTVAAGAAPAWTTRGLPGLIGTILNAVAMQASWLRYRERLAQTTVIEAVMPLFLRDMLQGDAALRGAVETFLNIQVGTIDTWFTSKRIRPQWVYDFSDALADGEPTGWGGATPPRDWPAEVKILIYPAGTYALAQRPMVRVSGVRNDPQLLRQNVFLALFMEQAYAVVSRCPSAVALTVPTCVSGEAVLTSVAMEPRCAPAAP